MTEAMRSRLIVRVTPPAIEPISLAEAKQHLRVEHSADDALITQLIIAARESAEGFLLRALITQSWKVVYDDAAPMRVGLPYGPVQSVGIQTISRGLVVTSIASDRYAMDASRRYLLLDTEITGWQVEIYYVSGYGNAASDVPAGIRAGILAHVGAMYESRDGFAALPEMSRLMYAPHREVRL